MRACVWSLLLQRVRLFATAWTIGHQAPLSMGFSKQEYWSRLPCPPPGHLPDPGIEPRSPPLQMDSLTAEPPGKPLDLRLTLNIVSSRDPWLDSTSSRLSASLYACCNALAKWHTQRHVTVLRLIVKCQKAQWHNFWKSSLLPPKQLE